MNQVSGISFAIPMDVAWQVIEQLRKYRNVRRPYLGIKFVSEAKGTPLRARSSYFGGNQRRGMVCMCVRLKGS